MTVHAVRKQGSPYIEFWFENQTRPQKLPVVVKKPRKNMSPKKEDVSLNFDVEEYCIHPDECFRKFDETSNIQLPDNYYIGATDPRETGGPNTQNIVEIGSLWHDTENGLLKRLIHRINGHTGGSSEVWIGVLGRKFCADEDGTIIGEIVRKNDVGNDFSADKKQEQSKPPLRLNDLILKLREKESLLDDADEDAD
jgi:hypothetical protein